MVELPKISTRLLKKTDMAKDMTVGEDAFFEFGSMRIDHAGHGWIDPMARKIDDPGDDASKLAGNPPIQLKRIEDGFEVNLKYVLTRGIAPWETREIPNPAHVGVTPWYPVKEFFYGQNGSFGFGH
jgi:hypothetical protein